MTHDSVSVYLIYLASQIPIHATALDTYPQPSLFQLLLPLKAKLSEYLTSHKALMIFHNDAPNSHVTAFLELLVNALSATSHSKSAKHICKSHTASPEKSLYFLLSNT